MVKLFATHLYLKLLCNISCITFYEFLFYLQKGLTLVRAENGPGCPRAGPADSNVSNWPGRAWFNYLTALVFRPRTIKLCDDCIAQHAPLILCRLQSANLQIRQIKTNINCSTYFHNLIIFNTWINRSSLCNVNQFCKIYNNACGCKFTFPLFISLL